MPTAMIRYRDGDVVLRIHDRARWVKALDHAADLELLAQLERDAPGRPDNPPRLSAIVERLMDYYKDRGTYLELASDRANEYSFGFWLCAAGEYNNDPPPRGIAGGIIYDANEKNWSSHT